MKNLLKKIFHNPFKHIPEKVKDAFHLKFPEALNVEWEVRNDIYEAVFYRDDIEFIAKISEDKGIVEYKQNLKLDDLPAGISTECIKNGEIMNAIRITRNSAILYEVIVRDKNLNRSVLLMDETGNLLESRDF